MSPMRRHSFYLWIGKRVLDVCLAGLAIVLLAPFALVLGVVIALRMGSPVLFLQLRPGLNGKPFTMFKFRTMTDATGPDGQPLPDPDRLTRLGAFLRRSSLDELPELVNVLKGDMSLVGPRPLLVEHLPLYNATQARRHEVKPGITGWAQINGRNAITFSRRIEHDVWYVDHQGFWLDLKIILMTVPKALLSRNVNVVERDEDIIDIGPGTPGHGSGLEGK
jgi:lipopolysaccharide/colanic/teichoic acid biosynthesis glycosyltransferase